MSFFQREFFFSIELNKVRCLRCPLFEHTALTIGLHEASSFVPAFQHSTKHLKINSLWSRVENTIDWAVGYWGLHYGSQLVNQVFRERFGLVFYNDNNVITQNILLILGQIFRMSMIWLQILH
jgi:hypothetical protein